MQAAHFGQLFSCHSDIETKCSVLAGILTELRQIMKAVVPLVPKGSWFSL